LNSKTAFIVIGDYNENLTQSKWITEFKIKQESCKFNSNNNNKHYNNLFVQSNSSN